MLKMEMASLLGSSDLELTVQLRWNVNIFLIITPRYAGIEASFFPLLDYVALYGWMQSPVLTNPDSEHPAGSQSSLQARTVKKKDGGPCSSGVSLPSRIFQPQKVNFHLDLQKGPLFSLCSR